MTFAITFVVLLAFVLAGVTGVVLRRRRRGR
ncbi:LPXTG cell wall anchor domain-containing protein [Desertivibrio insolitus]|nr:LPXTG cell wall anchor domain-containing protein [Herbiconiux sp. SYSU D00978]